MIIEKELGISADYQYKAINSKNFLQRNWHRNKFKAIDFYLGYLHNLKDKKVLDIGTGSGNFELLFNSKFRTIIGVDYNSDALEFLKKQLDENNISNVKINLFDITAFSIDDLPDDVDIVLMIDVIEHIRSSEAINLLNSLKDKIKDDAKIIIITPNYSSLWLMIEKVLDKFTIVPKFDGAQHIARYDTKSLKELFASSGYAEIYSTTINTLGYLFPIERISQMINRFEFASRFRYGNLVMSVFQKSLSEKKLLSIWDKYYGKDQENLYKNSVVRFIFDLGHKFISKNSLKKGICIDLGSGIGYHVKFENLNELEKYYCVDKNEESLKLLPKNEKIIPINSDGKSLDIQKESVDTVIASHIFEHIEDLELVLKEVSRVLKPSGKLLVALPCDPGFLWNLLTQISPSRSRLKMSGLNYASVMKHEHINEVNNVLILLDKYFKCEKRSYFPFLIPFININLIFAGKFSKREN